MKDEAVPRVQRHFHIRLTAANPNFADENVRKRKCVLALNDKIFAVETGFLRRQNYFQLPFSQAAVVAEAPLNETVTCSLGSAHPQTQIGFSRWNTALSVKHLGSETSARAEAANAVKASAAAKNVNNVFFIKILPILMVNKGRTTWFQGEKSRPRETPLFKVGKEAN